MVEGRWDEGELEEHVEVEALATAGSGSEGLQLHLRFSAPSVPVEVESLRRVEEDGSICQFHAMRIQT